MGGANSPDGFGRAYDRNRQKHNVIGYSTDNIQDVPPSAGKVLSPPRRKRFGVPGGVLRYWPEGPGGSPETDCGAFRSVIRRDDLFGCIPPFSSATLFPLSRFIPATSFLFFLLRIWCIVCAT